MKKIAICLSGAMSQIGDRFLTPKSLYNNNPYVNFNACYNSTKKHILDINNNCKFDFFIHSWNADLKEKLEELYCPQKSLFEDNSIFINEINSKIKSESDFGGVSKSLSIRKSILLLEDFQNENNFEYDLIISYRPDVLLLKNLYIKNYNIDKIYANSFNDGNGDFHFIMNYKNIKQFKDLYLSLDKGNEHKSHFWIKNYINNFMNQDLIEDGIIAGKDQEVIRKIHTGINTDINIVTLFKYEYEGSEMNQDNIYTKMQRDFYNSTADMMAIENHRGHDFNPDYNNILLKEINENPSFWKDKMALDFGCGIGRNIDNLFKLAPWKMVDGCDISSENIIRADKFLANCDYNSEQYNLYTTTGTTLNPIKNDLYDFVMSTIVLQHIAVHDIRTSLFTDIYRVMKTNALFSFQMVQYNESVIKCAKYNDNIWSASGTNGAFDVSINDPQDLINDLTAIGYKNISYEIKPEWDANSKCYLNSEYSKWIFFKAYK